MNAELNINTIDHKELSVKRQLFSLRYRWFKQQMREFLTRQRQTIVLILMIFPILPKVLAHPFISVAAMDVSQWAMNILYLIVLGLLAMVWIWAIRVPVSGGQFHRYMVTLPVDSKYMRQLDALIVLLAGLPFWLLFLMALLFVPFSEMSTEESTVFLLRLLSLMLLIAAVQTVMIRHLSAAALLFCVGGFAVFVSAYMPALASVALLLSAVLLMLLILLGLRPARFQRVNV